MMTAKSIVSNRENEGLGKHIILHARIMGLVVRRERRKTDNGSGRHDWYVLFGEDAKCAKGCIPDLELHVASANHCERHQPSVEEEEKALKILLCFLRRLNGNPLSELNHLGEVGGDIG